MPALIGFLILLGAMYHLFFRFDRWHSADKPGLLYEHDNLTGDTRVIRPDAPEARTRVSARILGEEGGLSDNPNDARDGLSGYGYDRTESRNNANAKDASLNPWGEPLVEVAPVEEAADDRRLPLRRRRSASHT